MHGNVHLYFEAAAMILTLVLLGQVLELRAHSPQQNKFGHAGRSGALIQNLVEDIKASLNDEQMKMVKELQEQGHIIAIAGDGINDAPALTQANIGIAMGTGTDIAMQSAEITLVKGDLNGIKARNLSSKVMRNIRQNLFFNFFIIYLEYLLQPEFYTRYLEFYLVR